MLSVGFSKVDITPSQGTLCALGLDDEAKEILGPAYLRATVLGEGEAAVGLLSVDVIGLCRPEITELRSAIAAATGLDSARIVVHATHTHESPSVRREWTEVTRPWGLVWHDEAFWESVKAAAVTAFTQALETSFTATVSYGQAPVAGIASNRRVVLADGRLVLRGSRSSAELRAYPEGWIDPFVRLVVLADGSSDREHWLMDFCCHPSAAGGDEGPYVTGDFPGEAMLYIEAENPMVGCSYFTGCCGNINPGKYTSSSNEPQARQADVARMGRFLADAALGARASAVEVEGEGLYFAQAPVELRLLDEFVDGMILEARIADQAAAYLRRRAAGERVIGGGPLAGTVNRLMVQRHTTAGVLQTEVAVMEWGDLAMVFLPGECFLELDAGLRQHFPDLKLVTVEVCDYTVGYMIPQVAYGLGGYEARAASCHPSSHGRLLDAASALLRRLDGA